MSEAPSLRSLTTLESGLNMVSSQPIDDAAKLDAQILAATAELAELQAQMEGKGGTVPSVAGPATYHLPQSAGHFAAGLPRETLANMTLQHSPSVITLSEAVTPPPTRGLDQSRSQSFAEGWGNGMSYPATPKDLFGDAPKGDEEIEAAGQPRTPAQQILPPETPATLVAPQTLPETLPEPTIKGSMNAAQDEVIEVSSQVLETVSKDVTMKGGINTTQEEKVIEVSSQVLETAKKEVPAQSCKPDEKQAGKETDAKYQRGSYWRMKRYFAVRKNGTTNASPSALKIFNSPGGSDKIHELLVASGGDWKKVEINIKKFMFKEELKTIKGAWMTAQQLKLAHNWTDDMVKHSKEWAKTQGLIRVSAIHGLEEWKLPMEEAYQILEGKRQETMAESTAVGEDPDGDLMRDTIDVNSVVRSASSMGESASSNPNPSAPQQSPIAAPGSGSRKGDALPVIQSNDPLGQVSVFIDCLGRKVDRAEEAKDKLADCEGERAGKLTTELKERTATVDKVYAELQAFQSSLVGIKEPSVKEKEACVALFVKATQCEMQLNNFLKRCRNFKPKTKKDGGDKKEPKTKKGSKTKASKRGRDSNHEDAEEQLAKPEPSEPEPSDKPKKAKRSSAKKSKK